MKYTSFHSFISMWSCKIHLFPSLRLVLYCILATSIGFQSLVLSVSFILGLIACVHPVYRIKSHQLKRKKIYLFVSQNCIGERNIKEEGESERGFPSAGSLPKKAQSPGWRMATAGASSGSSTSVQRPQYLSHHHCISCTIGRKLDQKWSNRWLS